MYIYCSLCLFCLIINSSIQNEFNASNNADPAANQLVRFKEIHKKPIGVLTTSAGAPVDVRDTATLNSYLIYNSYFMDSITHIDRERILERVVHAKAGGAMGYFEVTHDITKYCSANFLEDIGKKTPVIARFSPAVQLRGGTDLNNEARGFAIKFYTEEGNWDFVGFSIPVYFYRDPIHFNSFVHAIQRNPATNLLDMNALWDIITLQPESLHGFLWQFSDFGVPDGYRYMAGFSVHTYEVTNADGESHFVRFDFIPDQGIRNLSPEQQLLLRAQNPDYATRDLYNAIENGTYPSWTLYIEVMTVEEVKHADFNPFDVTRTWPRGRYPVLPVGKLVLNENPTNHFAQIEQLALFPGNLIPGILAPPDKIFQSRVLAYRDTQNYRLGVNHNKIEINRPLYAKTYVRDGNPPMRDNMKDVPNYYPNSFNGPIPIYDSSRPKQRLMILESNIVDFEPSRDFYTNILNAEQRLILANNIINNIRTVTFNIQKRVVALMNEVSPELGQRIALGVFNTTMTFENNH